MTSGSRPVSSLTSSPPIGNDFMVWPVLGMGNPGSRTSGNRYDREGTEVPEGRVRVLTREEGTL